MPKEARTIYANMTAASNALGVPVALLRRLKSENAPGFKPYTSRIYYDELKPALDAALAAPAEELPQASDKKALEARDLKAKAELRELRLLQAREKVVDKQIIADHLQRFAAEVRQVLRQKENELPVLLAGLTPEQIRPLLVSHVTDDILQKLAGHFDSWTI